MTNKGHCQVIYIFGLVRVVKTGEQGPDGAIRGDSGAFNLA